jgi:hypothetical protein
LFESLIGDLCHLCFSSKWDHTSIESVVVCSFNLNYSLLMMLF